jgi:cytochrome d ubiquinol oxidase subunit I
MDVEILSRMQFALNISFHYLFPPLSIGLGLILVIMEGMYLKTKNRRYEEMTKFWVKIFALTFALGVATGIVQVFGFGTNWANYSRFVGDVFGSALGAEGVFAFTMEAGFLGILLFGWNRCTPRVHFFSTIMVAAGAHFSAIWITVANSWMQTPAGYVIEGEGARAHAVITDFWEMVFNPSSMERLFHVIMGCWLAGAFFVISVSAFYLLKRRHLDFAVPMLKIGLVVAVISTLLQGLAGDMSGRGVAANQPAKLAAFEALYKTPEGGTPMSLIGIVNAEKQRIDYSLSVPKLLSFLVYRDFTTPVTGLDQFPEDDWPNVPVVYQTYHLMIFMWGLMLLGCVFGVIMWKKKHWVSNKWTLRFLVISVLFPEIANQAGWYSAEMGRQPWIVYNILRTSEGLSRNVGASQVLGSIIMFTIIYIILFILFIYLLNHKIQHGPTAPEDADPLYRDKFIIGKPTY